MTRSHFSRHGVGPAISIAIAGVLCTAMWPAPARAQYSAVPGPSRGQSYCTRTPLVVGNAIIPAGRCFKLAAVRTIRGTYVAFLWARAPITSGEIVGVGPRGPSGPFTPFLVVPVNAEAALPLNTMTLVPARIQTWGGQTRINVMSSVLAATIVSVPQTFAPAAPWAQPAPAAPAPVALPAPVAPPAPAAQPAPAPLRELAPAPSEGPANVVDVREGQVFCPSADLVAGGTVIPQGDCYRLSLLRNTNGTFLAFVPTAIALPASRVVALSGPAMGAVSRRAYLVPISTHAALKMNELIMVPSRISVVNGQEVIAVTGGPAANAVIRLGRRR